MKLKFKLWDVTDKKMYDVSNICFGDDGSALTITVQRAPKPKYCHLYVEGENGILLQSAGINDKLGNELYADFLFICDQYPSRLFRCWRTNGGFVCNTHVAMWQKDILEDRPPYFNMESLSEPQNISWFENTCTIKGSVYENPELMPKSKI